MSKHCEICKRTYPDELAACPYCAEEVDLAGDELIEVVEGIPDSAVDFSLPAAASDSRATDPAGQSNEGSGLSFVEWASLVEEKSKPPEPAAPADAIPLAHPVSPGFSGASAEAGAPSGAPPEEEDALAGDLAAVRSIFAGDASASFSRRPPSEEPAQPDDADDSALNLLAPDGEGPVVLPPEAVDSGMDLVGADLEKEIVAEALEVPPAFQPGDSGIDLSKALSAPEEPSGITIADSGLNLDEANAPPVEPTPNEPSNRPISDPSLDLSGDDITVATDDSGHLSGIEKNSPDTSESGRDLIAEEVESSLNLPHNQFKIASGKPGDSDAVAGQLASEEEEVDLTEMSSADVVDSSSIDLGASATFPAAAPEPPSEPVALESTRPFNPKSQSIHGEEELSPSEVNLGSAHHEPSKHGDFFDESGGFGGSGVPLETTASDHSDVLADDEPTVGMDDRQPEDDEAEAVEEEPERPVKGKKEKRPSMIGAGLGGAVLGGLLATSACLALWFFNIEPPQGWRGTVSNSKEGTTTNPASAPNTLAPAVVPFADRAAAVRSGDLERAQKAKIEEADETKADEVAARGEYRVRNYLAQQSANKKPIEPNDPTLQAGVKDLETAAKSDNPAVAADALFYLGVAREASKDYAGALKAYKEGADKFKGDAAQKERFEAGVNRVTPKTAGATGRAAPLDDGALLALLVTTLQPPDAAKPVEPAKPGEAAAPAPPAGEPAFTEAGSAFWRAVTRANEGKYDDALAAIKQASDLHSKRRFTMLGKAQNPNSDPTEEIFLRSCEELKSYWELQKKLSTSGLPLVKGKDPVAAVEMILAENKGLNEKLAKATADVIAQQKAVEAAEKNTEEAKTETEKTKKDFQAAQKDLVATKDDLEAKKKDLAAAEKKGADLTEKLKTAEATAAKEGETLKTVARVLTPKFLKPDAGEAALLPAVQSAARLAEITDPQGAIRGLEGEVAGLNSTLQQRWKPDQMLAVWLPLLRERGNNDLADKAIIDADRVLNEAKASPENKARAHAIKGIALRNEEKYAAAKAELEQAKGNLSKEDAPWWLETEAALKEASDPSAFFAARAETFRKANQTAQSLAMLNRALETAAPEAKARLIAERGALRFEQALAHGNGRAAPNDPDLLAAQKDAEEGKKAGGAAAFYLSGRIAEQRGRMDEALQDYRQALKAHSALDADGARYRAAVARLLILPRTAAPVRLGKAEGAAGIEVLAALIAVGVQPAEFPTSANPAAQEAVKLADEILSAKESDVPFEARAQAYAIKGLWTPALRVYVEGLRPFLSPEHAAGLLAIIDGHPNLRRPTVMTVADPVEAEKHYAAGLRWYNDREYAKAEKEFFTAVEQDSQDARYYYYLGLSQLMQGDRDAFEDFEQGARLEQQNRPPRAAVSAALERVQGPARLRLNDVRDRPR